MKCNVCSKKILIPVECKCKMVLCMRHRHPDSHQCNYNHHEAYKMTLKNTLIKISASKVVKI